MLRANQWLVAGQKVPFFLVARSFNEIGPDRQPAIIYIVNHTMGGYRSSNFIFFSANLEIL